MRRLCLAAVASTAITLLGTTEAGATTWTTYTGTGECMKLVTPSLVDYVPVNLRWVTEHASSAYTGGSVTISSPNGRSVQYGLWFKTTSYSDGSSSEQGRFVGEAPGGYPWYVNGSGMFAPDGWLGITTGTSQSVCLALGYVQ